MNDWMSEWMNEWMNEWMKEWINELINRRTNQWMESEWQAKLSEFFKSISFSVFSEGN